jgi:hypothetical protein
VVPLALAVTVAAEQALMAAARFDASVAAELLAAKVPVVVPQVVDPFDPAVGAAQVNRVLSPVPESVTAPSVLAVTVTSLLPATAVAPKPEQLLIASAMDPPFWLELPLLLYVPVYVVGPALQVPLVWFEAPLLFVKVTWLVPTWSTIEPVGAAEAVPTIVEACPPFAIVAPPTVTLPAPATALKVPARVAFTGALAVNVMLLAPLVTVRFSVPVSVLLVDTVPVSLAKVAAPL